MRHLNFTKLETKTGVPLWVMSLPDAGSVAAGVLVRAGTRDEIWPREAGIAHALEHMHFQGTKALPSSKDIFGYVEEVGGRVNAWTWKEATFYWSYVPASAKERAVKVLSEQLRRSTFPEDKIPVEMKNIIQEIRRWHDDPKRFVNSLAEKLLYADHPLANYTLGSEESVLQFMRRDFVTFKERYYDSANYTFVAAGAITPEDAIQLFDTSFPEASEKKLNVRRAIPLPHSEKTLIREKDSEQVYIVLIAPIGKSDEKMVTHADLFQIMIAGGASFPLFQEVRDRRGLCYEILAETDKLSDIGNFRIYVGTDPRRFKEAIEASLEVVERSQNSSPLLEKAKGLALGRLALKYENMADVINIAAHDIAATGMPKGFDELQKEIEGTTVDDIEKATHEYFHRDAFKIALIVPGV